MKQIFRALKKHEKEIITQSYKIALIKQDIVLGIIDAINEVIKEESSAKISNEEIAEKLFDLIKSIPNEEIEKYMQADIEEKPKIKLRIEQQILKKLKKGKFKLNKP